MSGKARLRDLVAANRAKWFLSAMGVVLCAVLFLSCPVSLAHAAIVGSGDVSPTNPTTWTSSTSGYIGLSSTGTVTVDGGSSLLSGYGYLGYNSGSTGTATVTGTGSTWTINSNLYVGDNGSGTLTVGDGGVVTVAGILSLSTQDPHSSGTLNIGDNTSTGGLVKAAVIAFENVGTCNINNGGKLQFAGLSVGPYVANFIWNDGTIQNYDTNTDLSISPYLILKLAATGTHAFNIDQGRNGYVDAVLSNATTKGTLTKTGAGILKLAGANTYSGETVVEAGTLKYSTAAAMTSGPYTVNGGTLDIGAFSKSIGVFRITGGTVNGTGTLTSNAPYDVQAGTVNPRLAGTVGLNKTGAGVLALTGANTYSGETVVEAGRFKVTGSILNSSGVTVDAAGTLELASTASSATAADLAISNDGTLLISAGSQRAGAITGTGITQVNAGASLTAASIVQDSLIIGATGAAGAAEIGQVPEPSTLALLLAGVIGVLIMLLWRRAGATGVSPVLPAPNVFDHRGMTRRRFF